MASISFVNLVLLLGAALVLTGIASSLVATRFGAPILLVFLVLGMLAGEDGPGGIVFNNYQATYLVASLALAVILFDGGLRTKLASFRGTLAPSVVLATVGVLITTGLTGLVAGILLDVSLLEGLLIGATVASTDAAAVFFLVRAGGLQLRRRVNAVLEIESSTNDPVAVFLTIVLVELLLAGGSGPTPAVLGQLAQEATLGLAFGLAGGLGAAWLLNRVDLPSGLHPVFVIAAAVFTYALTALAHGSGFLAVYVAGLVLGNRPVRAVASVMSFTDAATWFCQIVMFLMLGLLVTPARLLDYAAPALAVAVFLMFVGRPLAVALCLTPFGFTWRETAFVSWVGLRGAVSIFLAAIPTLAGVPNAEAYFNVAFFVVLVSLTVQGWSLTTAAKRLGVALPRAAASVRRVELDLPGQLAYEMVGYPLAADSPALAYGVVPGWARLVLVVRDKGILLPEEAGRLRVGDYVYFLAPPDRVYRLDRLFAPAGEEGAERGLLGTFVLNGDAPLGKIADAYNFTVTPEERGLTVAELFAREVEGTTRVGERLVLGAAVLVAREVRDGAVVRAGLVIDDLAVSFARAALLGRFGLRRLGEAGAPSPGARPAAEQPLRPLAVEGAPRAVNRARS